MLFKIVLDEKRKGYEIILSHSECIQQVKNIREQECLLTVLLTVSILLTNQRGLVYLDMCWHCKRRLYVINIFLVYMTCKIPSEL